VARKKPRRDRRLDTGLAQIGQRLEHRGRRLRVVADEIADRARGRLVDDVVEERRKEVFAHHTPGRGPPMLQNPRRKDAVMEDGDPEHRPESSSQPPLEVIGQAPAGHHHEHRSERIGLLFGRDPIEQLGFEIQGRCVGDQLQAGASPSRRDAG
jgi:hypothetical protein